MKKIFFLMNTFFYVIIAFVFSILSVFLLNEKEWHIMDHVLFSLFAGISASIIDLLLRKKNRRYHIEK